jgi:hypothetical protein
VLLDLGNAGYFTGDYPAAALALDEALDIYLEIFQRVGAGEAAGLRAELGALGRQAGNSSV